MRLTGRLWIEAWVNEAKLADVPVGSPAEISLGTAPTGSNGRVESIGALTNNELLGAVVPPTLGQFVRPPTMVNVRIALEREDDPRLVPGLTAVVGIAKQPSSDAGRGWDLGEIWAGLKHRVRGL